MIMPDSTRGQGIAFLICLAFGAAAGAVYEAGYIIRFTGKFKAAVSIIADLLFFAVAALLFAAAARASACGAVRLYTVLGFALGFIIERLTLGILVAKAVKWVYTLLSKIYRALRKVKVFKKLLK